MAIDYYAGAITMAGQFVDGLQADSDRTRASGSSPFLQRNAADLLARLADLARTIQEDLRAVGRDAARLKDPAARETVTMTTGLHFISGYQTEAWVRGAASGDDGEEAVRDRIDAGWREVCRDICKSIDESRGLCSALQSVWLQWSQDRQAKRQASLAQTRAALGSLPEPADAQQRRACEAVWRMVKLSETTAELVSQVAPFPALLQESMVALSDANRSLVDGAVDVGSRDRLSAQYKSLELVAGQTRMVVEAIMEQALPPEPVIVEWVKQALGLFVWVPGVDGWIKRRETHRKEVAFQTRRLLVPIVFIPLLALNDASLRLWAYLGFQELETPEPGTGSDRPA